MRYAKSKVLWSTYRGLVSMKGIWSKVHLQDWASHLLQLEFTCKFVCVPVYWDAPPWELWYFCLKTNIMWGSCASMSTRYDTARCRVDKSNVPTYDIKFGLLQASCLFFALQTQNAEVKIKTPSPWPLHPPYLFRLLSPQPYATQSPRQSPLLQDT